MTCKATAMTTDTTQDPRPDPTSDAAVDPPITSKAEAGPATATASAASEPDLQSRIKGCRAELAAKLRELKMDKRLEATEVGDKLKAKLAELSHILKWGVVDGWASLGDSVKHRLEHWLTESRSQLLPQDKNA